MKKNFENLLFYSLVLLIPTQLGRHFWPDFSYIYGFKIDYLSPTVYLTDLLVFLLFTFWIFRKLKQKPTKSSKFKVHTFGKLSTRSSKLKLKIQKHLSLLVPAFVIGYLLLTIVFSGRVWGGLYILLKLFEMGFVAYYTAQFISHNYGERFRKVILLLSLGGIYESLIAIAQFVNKGSIGGPLYLLGERTFNSGTPGIANASLNGELVLRAYGTLPHPNVLAGYLLVAMTLILFSFRFRKPRQEAKSKKQEAWGTQRVAMPLLHNTIVLREAELYLLIQATTLVLGTVALILSMSRVAILLWILIFTYYIFRKTNRAKYLIFILIAISLFLLTPIGTRFGQLNIQDEAVAQRSILAEKALGIINVNPLFGVGLGNFLPRLAEAHKPLVASTYLQPVHNIFLLVTAETGFVGLGFFMWFLWKTFKAANGTRSASSGQDWQMANGIFICFLAVLITGLFDHYWLTLQQGQLLFAFIIGLCYNPSLYDKTTRRK